MESARKVSHSITILPPYFPYAWYGWWRPALLIALTALAIAASALVLAPTADHEATITTADGTRWTISDASSYLRGRLDDEHGRTYCERLITTPQDASTSADQRLLARLTAEACARRLAQTW